MLREIISNANNNARFAEFPESKLKLLSDLLTIPVPALSDLDPKDIVTLRRNEASFDQWRKGLTLAIEQIRKEYNTWKYGSEQRFQRVYSVIKRK